MASQFKTVAEVADEIQYMDLTEDAGRFPSGERVSWRMVRAEPSVYHTEKVVCPALCEGGDYGNTGFVGKANYKYFEENFKDHPDVCFRFGGHGSYGVIIRASCTDEDIIEVLCGLSDYPVIDDDLMSELENKAAEEAWDSWIHGDLEKEIRKAFDPTEQVGDDEFDSGELYQLYYELQDRSGEYVHEDGNDMYVDVKKLVKVMDLDDLKKVLSSTAYELVCKTRKNI